MLSLRKEIRGLCYQVLGGVCFLASLSVSTTVWGANAVMPSIRFVTPSIVRVQWHPEGKLDDNGTGVCVYQANDSVVPPIRTDGDVVRYVSDEITVEVDRISSAVRFIDTRTGRILLKEDPSSPRSHRKVFQESFLYDEASARIEETANGKVTVKDILRRDTTGISDSFRINFLMDGRQGLYGLGSHMEDYMNLLGKTLYLTQHNLKITVPVIVSTLGYGLLFDAGCAMKFESRERHATGDYLTSMELDAARELDYYFIKGRNMEDVALGYRYLTGSVSMMPRYLFGYIQSKERYKSSDDIISTLREMRRRHVPVDMIVQDWNYWPQGWGYMKMDERYYPDPAALADSVHALNAKLMVSIWANPQNCPQEKDFRAQGFMLENSVYDAFNPEARKYYWGYADREFFSKGFDAWWCDSSEPLDGDWNKMPEPVDGRPYGRDDHERRWHLNKEILSATLGAERSSLYSLYHTKGIYENQRATGSGKRVVNLTRSGYAGQQRYGTIVWNGDASASWESLRQQIPSGLNYMATGNPYWTVDVGCFFTGSDGRWFRKGVFPDGVADDGYKEFYTRMLQWAAFLPVMRSHGTDTPREIWHFGEPGTPYYDAILRMIRLRYSLNPYIYSMAAAQTAGGYSMARMLAFDFPEDEAVRDIKDQYMFGDFLVCPVTSPGVSSRRVYLPGGEAAIWIDYWTGERHHGGKWMEATAPLDRLPLFVRGGSIVASADEPVEYTGELVGKPVTLNIFPGRDAAFVFYDDAGDGYGYESGESVRIPISWSDGKKILTIGASRGSYPGAPGSRRFVIRTPGKTKAVTYTGKSLKVRL